MLVVLRTSWPLLFGMLLLLMGNGVQGTLLGIRGGLEGIDAASMSLVMSGYYLGFLVGSRLGAKLSGAEEGVVKWAGFGLLPQAGLALALALLFTKTFPSFGDGASALTLGVVACNEIVAPALLRYALVQSGEAGKRDPAEVGEVAAH